ncbi:MAG: hypothetical protein ACK5LL_13745 [Suipraeoptans sp.]
MKKMDVYELIDRLGRELEELIEEQARLKETLSEEQYKNFPITSKEGAIDSILEDYFRDKPNMNDKEREAYAYTFKQEIPFPYLVLVFDGDSDKMRENVRVFNEDRDYFCSIDDNFIYKYQAFNCMKMGMTTTEYEKAISDNEFCFAFDEQALLNYTDSQITVVPESVYVVALDEMCSCGIICTKAQTDENGQMRWRAYNTETGEDTEREDLTGVLEWKNRQVKHAEETVTVQKSR